jgi:hypothetical protein
MSHHFEQISKTQLFLEVNKDDVHAFCAGEKDDISVLTDEKERLFILELCLHCADVSNPYKPFGLYEKWCKLVTEEFGQQGDREKLEGLEVSPMCDRNSINLPSMQYSFIQYVVSPLIVAFIQLFYPLHEIGDNILYNYLEWSKRKKIEIMNDNTKKSDDKDIELEKIDNQMSAFEEKFEFLNELKSKPVRNSQNRAKLFQKAHKHNSGNVNIMNKMSGNDALGSTPRQKKILGKD